MLAEVVPVADLKVGDVITYTPPRGSGPDGLVTHRIASIGRDDQGGRVFRTKGDANPVADPWTFSLDSATQARVRYGIPYAGHALARARAARRADGRDRAPRAPDRAVQPRPALARARRGGAQARRRGNRVTRAVLALLALLALLSAGGVTRSGADFTASAPSPGNNFSAAADFNTVAVTLSDPGSPLRGSVALAATASSERGVDRVRFETSPAGAGTWTTACEDTVAPYACDWTPPPSPTAARHPRRRDRQRRLRARLRERRRRHRRQHEAGAGAGRPRLPAGQRDPDRDGDRRRLGRRHARDRSTAPPPAAPGPPSAPAPARRAPARSRPPGWPTARTSCGRPPPTGPATPTPRRLTRTVDNTAPTVAVVAPPAALRGSATVALTAADGAGSGVREVRTELRPSGAGAWTPRCSDQAAPYECVIDTTQLADGLYDLRAIADDDAGFTTTSATTVVRVDNTPPPTPTLANPGTNLSGTVALTGTASDARLGHRRLDRALPAGRRQRRLDRRLQRQRHAVRLQLEHDGRRGRALRRARGRPRPGRQRDGLDDADEPADRQQRPDGDARRAARVPARDRRAVGHGHRPGRRAVGRVRAQARERHQLDGDLHRQLGGRTRATSTPTSIADGSYELRARATDTLGRSSTSSVGLRQVDNTDPDGDAVESGNGGATAGRLEAGDWLLLTWTEQIAPASVLARLGRLARRDPRPGRTTRTTRTG